jgi:hypothetical protein
MLARLHPTVCCCRRPRNALYAWGCCLLLCSCASSEVVLASPDALLTRIMLGLVCVSAIGCMPVAALACEGECLVQAHATRVTHAHGSTRTLLPQSPSHRQKDLQSSIRVCAQIQEQCIARVTQKKSSIKVSKQSRVQEGVRRRDGVKTKVCKGQCPHFGHDGSNSSACDPLCNVFAHAKHNVACGQSHPCSVDCALGSDRLGRALHAGSGARGGWWWCAD